MKKIIFLLLFLFCALLFTEADTLSVRKEIVMPDGTVYLATNSRGLLSVIGDDVNLIPLNKGLPKKNVYPFTKTELRPITS